MTSLVRPLFYMLIGLSACAPAMASSPASLPGTADAPGATLAQVYYWRAKPGKFDEYSRYVRDVAEPIDREAQRQGAFISINTYVSRDTLSPWTHMRVFLLRDSTQLADLPQALTRAGERLEPDSTRRRARSTYAVTLRDRVAETVLQVLR